MEKQMGFGMLGLRLAGGMAVMFVVALGLAGLRDLVEMQLGIDIPQAIYTAFLLLGMLSGLWWAMSDVLHELHNHHPHHHPQPIPQHDTHKRIIKP